MRVSVPTEKGGANTAFENLILDSFDTVAFLQLSAHFTPTWFLQSSNITMFKTVDSIYGLRKTIINTINERNTFPVFP